MQYDLAPNDRFFLNQLIPKWDSGKPFDLNVDMKYVFRREKGANYNPAQCEYTLKTIAAFLTDHGFAKENPARQYTFTLLPKGNMLLVSGTIEQFELYQEQGRITGGAIATPSSATARTKMHSDTFAPDQHARRHYKGNSVLRTLIILGVLLAISIIVWMLLVNNS